MKKIEQKLLDLFDEFKEYKINIEGKSVGTLIVYLRHIEEFCNDMEIFNFTDFININANVVKDWLIKLTNKNNSNTTRNNKLSAIKQIYTFLYEEKEINIDLKILKIKFSKTAKKENYCITEEQMIELQSIITNERTKCAVAIICDTGLRFSELMQITCDDIERGFAVVVGKGNKERKVYFTPSCIEISQRFITNKRQHIIERTGKNTNILLISDEGNLMDLYNFTKSLKHYARKIGLYWYEEMSPHKLRHGYITKMLNNGVPVHIVKEIVGHSNISVTDRYAHTTQDMIEMYMTHEYE